MTVLNVPCSTKYIITFKNEQTKNTENPDMVVHTCNPSIWVEEEGVTRDQDQPQLNGKLEAILGHIKPCLKKN